LRNTKTSYAFHQISAASDLQDIVVVAAAAVVVVVVVVIVVASVYVAVLAVAGNSESCLGRSLTALLAHIGGNSRLHVDGLHVRRANDIAFRRISDLFLRHNAIDL